MTVDNGNGELRQLLEVKHAYRADLAAFEAELKTRYERELAEGKKRFKEQYLERIVDVVFAESTSPLAPVEAPKPEPEAEPTPQPPHECPECGAAVTEDAKFCSHCAYPLKEEEKHDEPSETVVSTGRKFSVRVR